MKIAKKNAAVLLTNSYLTSYGGIGPFVRNLDKDLNSYFNLTYFFLPASFEKIRWVPHRLMYVVFLILSFFKLKKFDFIISHSPEGSYIASFTGKPLIHVFHGNTNPMTISRFKFGKYLNFVFDHIHAVITKKACLLFSVGEKREGVFKFVNPISHEIGVQAEDKRKGFIFAGRLEKPKGVDQLIKVYYLLPKSVQEQNPFEIAGTGSELQRLKNLVLKLGLESNITFLGNLENRDLIKVISEKKILLMASSFEGFPMVIAEAFSVGVPVISTAVGDIPEFVKQDENGLLFPVGFNFEDYATGIVNILSRYKHYAGNAFLSSEPFDASVVAKGFVDKVEETLSQVQSK